MSECTCCGTSDYLNRGRSPTPLPGLSNLDRHTYFEQRHCHLSPFDTLRFRSFMDRLKAFAHSELEQNSRLHSALCPGNHLHPPVFNFKGRLEGAKSESEKGRGGDGGGGEDRKSRVDMGGGRLNLVEGGGERDQQLLQGAASHVADERCGAQQAFSQLSLLGKTM